MSLTEVEAYTKYLAQNTCNSGNNNKRTLNKFSLLEWLRKFHPTLVEDHVESEEESVEAHLGITRAVLDDLNEGLPFKDQFHL